MSRCWPDDYVPLNGCSSCCLDFTSVDAFDRHRVGSFEYDWTVDRTDGRRCLDADELRRSKFPREHGEADCLVCIARATPGGGGRSDGLRPSWGTPDTRRPVEDLRSADGRSAR